MVSEAAKLIHAGRSHESGFLSFFAILVSDNREETLTDMVVLDPPGT